MYIINVVARVCSSPLPAPCPRNKARVIPDATKLIPPPTPQSLWPDHRKFTSQWRFFPWSENRELGIFDAGPRRTREKTLTNNTGPLKFPYRRVFPPPRTPPHYRLVLIFTCQSIKCWIEETCWPIGYAIYGSILPLPLPPHYNHVGSCNLTCCLTCNVNVS